MSYSQEERLALSALLEEIGPDAPTLCAGWATRDLAAHLVLRERRPVAAAGVLGGPAAGHTRRVQEHLKKRHSYPELIGMFRSGPPRFSPFSIPGFDERANTVEYFVHHEDVRRATADWEPRAISAGLSDALWRGLRATRFLLRKAPVGVELARDNGGGGQSHRVTVRNATPVVTVVGPPAELTLWAMGRTSAARVRFDGTDDAVEAMRKWRLLAAHLPLEAGEVVLDVNSGVRRRRYRRGGHRGRLPWLTDLVIVVAIMPSRQLPAPGRDLDRERDGTDDYCREHRVHHQVDNGSNHHEHDDGTDRDGRDLHPAHPVESLLW